MDNFISVMRPAKQTAPLVFASPHSGRDYPADFVAASALDPMSLRKSEDSYVDELFAAAEACGAPLLKALYPRAFLDPNREPYELDPAMFDEALPDYVNTRSPRVSAGLGTIARVVANGAEIYAGKLRFAEAERRIDACYRPYHNALRQLIDETRRSFGYCILIDCHSMPSVGGPMDRDTGRVRVDFVLGDCYGTSCASSICNAVDKVLSRHGYRVVRNAPYAGGFTTRHYGQPLHGVHALQIEVNRALYMDEATHVRRAVFPGLQAHIGEAMAALAALPEQRLAAE